ncbi:MAG: hypothetical protein JW924_05550 [Fusobacteriaceae bacterium]|nr:hypothetical protein [Fusobacteriaceae bacterium]
MRKGISKNRPKGTEYGRIKSEEKLKRKLEEKKRVNQIENAKKNAVRRKEQEEKRERKEMIKQVEIVDFIKNSFIIDKEGVEEKRVLKIPNNLKKSELDKYKDLITLTLYGEDVPLRNVKCSEEIFNKIKFYLEEKI